MDFTDPLTVTTAHPALLATGGFLALVCIYHLVTQWTTTNTTTKAGNKRCQYPACLPISLLQTVRHMTSPNCATFFLEWARKVGYVYRLRLPSPDPIFVIGDPLLSREIQTDATATKPSRFYKPVDRLTGGPSIFTADGFRWKHARKAVSPAFANAHIKRMNQVCKEQLDDWIQRRMENFCQTNESFDPGQELVLLTLAIISRAAFAYEMTDEEAKTFSNDWKIAQDEFVMHQLNNPIRSTWLGYLFAASEIKRARLACQDLHALGFRILQNYKNNAAPNSRQVKGTVIDCIVNNTQYRNDQERVADILSFLSAGADPTAYSLTWAMLDLASHPQELNRVREALQPLATEEERRQAPCLKNAVMESMRLHPISAFGAIRQLQRQVQVDAMTVIPKGAIVFCANILVHRNEFYFDNPDAFIPDRWSNIKEKSVAYLPFGVGPRSCPGLALAEAEIYTVLSRLIMEYDVEVVNHGTPEYVGTLKPVGALIKIKHRNA